MTKSDICFEFRVEWNGSAGQDQLRECWDHSKYGEGLRIQVEDDSATTQPMFPTTMSHSGLDQQQSDLTGGNVDQRQQRNGTSGMFNPCKLALPQLIMYNHGIFSELDTDQIFATVEFCVFFSLSSFTTSIKLHTYL
jgi:hypothetical protein